MQRRYKRIVLVLALVLGAGVLTTPVRAQDDSGIYSARGPYVVGVRDYVIEDADRPLDVSVWYPASNPDDLPEEVVYDAVLFEVTGQAIRDAAPDTSGGPYPLVVFSHGAGGFRQQSVYLTEHLASHGFVVIASEHPRSNLYAYLGDSIDIDAAVAAINDLHTDLGTLMSSVDQLGGPVDLVSGLAEDFGYRPLDVLRQIDFAETLTAPDGDLAGMIDTDTIAVSGHSFGGYTAMAAGGARLDFDHQMQWCRDPYGFAFDPSADPALTEEPVNQRLVLVNCFVGTLRSAIAQARGLDDVPEGLWPATTDPRIRAVVALAPWNASVFGERGLDVIAIPVMVQVGSADQVTPPVIDAYTHYQHVSSADKALVVFEGADHWLFANAGMPGIDDPAWDMNAAHELVNHFTTAFLRAHLLGDKDAAAVLAPEAVDFARIQYTRTD